MSQQTSPRTARALTVGVGVLVFGLFAYLVPLMFVSPAQGDEVRSFGVAVGALFGLGSALLFGQFLALADDGLEPPVSDLLPGIHGFAAAGALCVAGVGALSASFALAPAFWPSLLAGGAAGALAYLPLALALPEG